MYPLKDTRCFH